MMPANVQAVLLLISACVISGEQPSFWPKYAGLREVELLDGTWKFGLHLDPSFDSMDQVFDPRPASLTPNETQVPSSMDVAMPGVSGARGVAIYRTKFRQVGHARLQFMACSFYCRVFVDGAEVGDHRAGGYVAWWLDLPSPSLSPTSLDRHNDGTFRELVVLADNRFNSTTAPTHTGGDFWIFGGLMRSVVLHNMPDTGVKPWPWRAYVFPSPQDPSVVSINVSLTDPSFEGDIDCSVSFDGKSDSTLQITARAVGGMAVLTNLSVPKPRFWTLKDPQLHTVTVNITDASITERFGLRSWRTDSKTRRITLNGEVVKLHGWNHHTQWPVEGGATASPTNVQLDEDIQLLSAAGANYVRGAHYPQDQRWLDRLDEAGMAMWEETLGPSVTVAELIDPAWMQFQLQQVDEMILQSLNHPSIMTWGWFNEGPSDDPKACAAYAACADRAKTLDSTRFVTWASNKLLNDVCLEHASIVSFNGYPGWYAEAGSTQPTGFGNLTAPKTFWSFMANSIRSRFPDKPFTISETGAGSVYEWSDNATAALWTQAYQSEVLVGDVDVALGNENISGVSLWHFFDFKINDHRTVQCGPCEYAKGIEPPICSYVNLTALWPSGDCKRPKGENNKGVVDFWRRKKISYNIVAQKFNDFEELTHFAQAIVV